MSTPTLAPSQSLNLTSADPAASSLDPASTGLPSIGPVTDSPAGGDGTLANGQPRAFGATVLPHVEWCSSRPILRSRGEARFVFISQLGEGGLGEVVAVRDQDIGRNVAIKRIRADRVSTPTIVRFLQEIRTVGRLEHPNIIPIHDVGRDADGALYFVMRHVDGETLASIISRLRAGDADAHRRYGFERRVQIIGSVLEALAFAHNQGVVHRDIKPANVMVGRWGEVMLLDWGLARQGDANDADADTLAPPESLVQTAAGAILGSPLYMSPEQARGEPIDARSDLYSLSVTMHELLTLRHYLQDLSALDDVLAAVQDRPVPLAASFVSPHQGRVPMDLAWFIEAGARKHRDLRYPSARAMLDRLARRDEGDIPIQCHVTLTKRASFEFLRYFDRHIYLVSVVMALAGLGLLLCLVSATVYVVASRL